MTEHVARLSAVLADRYRIEREVGAGGMATVYLARDLRHERKVALKVLRADLAAVIGAGRFLQEIRTTANLQHPHILPLHDSGQVDGTVYYVMPFIEGESLRGRLVRDKQLPVEEALRITREVADAVGYAHERGIIHRDIKPENILLQGGHALVADFGIALAASRSGGTSRMTETGMSLGTPTYMSPEQAMGERDLGPRSDVYALGCVAYEMLCGEPPFTGPTPQAIVARVMTEAPRSIRSQRQTVPENVEAAVLQALEKLPADRFGSAAGFAEALGQAGFTRTTSSARAAGGAPRVMRWKTIALGLGVAVLALGTGLVIAVQKRGEATAPAQPVIRFEVPIPDSIPVDLVRLTPDGKRLLVQGTSRSYLYSFADMQWQALPIPELRGFLSTSLSPDGRWVAFLDDARNLKVASIDGGATRTLTDRAGPIRWESDGFIYLSRTEAGRSRIARLRPEGGPLEELLAAGDSIQGFAVGPLLPGGELVYTSGNRANERESRNFVLELPGKKPHPLEIPGGFWVTSYVPSGHLLLYGRDAVYAVGFDAANLKVLGAPIRITTSLPTNADYQAGIFAHPATPPGGPALFDRAGRRRELPGAIVSGAWGFGPRVSRSGHAIAFWRYQTPADRWDVFSYRMPGGPVTRISSDSGGRMVSWSADDEEIRFVGSSSGPGKLLSGQWDGSTRPRETLTPPGGVGQSSALPDGKRLVIESPGRGLVLVTLGVADSGVTLVPVSSAPRFPRVSPDGRWLAYSALELGRREVFVRPLDAGASRWQVSRNGGNNPVWARSGRELFFYINDTIRVAGLGRGPGFQAGEPRPLFRVDVLPDYSGFDVLPGDSLFVLHATSSVERERIVVTVNFLQELRTLKPSALGQGNP